MPGVDGTSNHVWACPENLRCLRDRVRQALGVRQATQVRAERLSYTLGYERPHKFVEARGCGHPPKVYRIY